MIMHKITLSNLVYSKIKADLFKNIAEIHSANQKASIPARFEQERSGSIRAH